MVRDHVQDVVKIIFWLSTLAPSEEQFVGSSSAPRELVEC